ncbi:MAG: DUF6320 domain-containing protein [Planctomycetota bacterium]|nr:DUF6320 domain-containing protein [Planctomycetota bacterium]
MEACPLCGAPIQRFEPEPTEPARFPDPVPMPNRHVRHLVWSVSTAVLLSAGLTFLTLDLILSSAVTWSRYPLTGVGVLWVFITLVVLVARRPIFVIAGQAVATAGFLLAIDFFDGKLSWFMPLALPIVAIATTGSVLVWIVTRLSRRAPAMIAASVLLACATSAVGLDLIVSAHHGEPGVSWSFIVLGAVVPPMLFLLYFHYRLRKKIDLRRILHT